MNRDPALLREAALQLRQQREWIKAESPSVKSYIAGPAQWALNEMALACERAATGIERKHVARKAKP